MSPLAINHRWRFVVNFLLFGILLQNHFCETTETNGYPMLKSMLFIAAESTSITNKTTFPSSVVYRDDTETQVCFNIPGSKSNADCCTTNGFDCSTKVKFDNNNIYNLTLNQTTLSKHDVVVLLDPTHNFSCMPSHFYNSTGLMLHLDYCLRTGGNNIRLSQDGLCAQNVSFDDQTCQGFISAEDSNYVIKLDGQNKTCVSCKLPGVKPEKSFTLNASNVPVKPQEAVNVMNKLGSLLVMMGNSSSAAIRMGNITGVIAKLPQHNQTNIDLGFLGNGDVNIIDANYLQVSEFSRTIQIPKEAGEMAVERNGSYAGVLLFPDMYPNDNSLFFNNEFIGIEMGANVSNLSQTIDIYYSKVNQSGANVSCMSWDGKGNSKWTTDGCQTVDANGSVTCRCSHLTFFAILVSPAPTNISASDYKTLTQITKVGCGVSMFFLGVALFMHFLMRKTKATNAAKVLVNLFVAMFALNFCFLINDTIADLDNPTGCVAIAAFLHYSMLATFTWFSMQALHLYCSLRKFPAEIKHYMYKIYAAGWVTPAVAIIALLALKKYGIIVIHVDDGSSANMCWILDSAISLGLNVGYYAVVFLFTFSIFSITVVQIVHFQSKPAKGQNSSSTKKKFFSILGLFCLLGISWGFAFFSFGLLLIPSYYIFTILNSFQGFLLFIYYYYSTKVTPEASKAPQTTPSLATAIENTYVASPQ